jgi:hypothetical protein
MKLLIIEFSATSCHVPLQSKYSPQGILYILIFMFLYSRQDERRLWTEF